MAARKRGPSGPQPAPGRLAIVQDFLNTVRRRKKREEVGSPSELERWLERRELLPVGTTLTAADHRRVIAAREALRSLAAANNGARFDPTAVDRLGSALEGLRFKLRLDADGAPAFEPGGSGAEGALGKLLAHVHAAWVRGRWPRLKACADPTCRAAYYDFNGRARYCTRACASRVRAAAFRRGEKHSGRG